LSAAQNRFASARPTSPSKTRARNLHRTPSGRLSRRRRFRPMFTPGSRPCAYRTASGRAKWPNRDPLGELGGFNLYSYTSNDPVNGVDVWGLFKNPNWPPIKPPPGGPRPPGPGVGNWMGLLISAASALIDIDCQGKCPRSSCESCCKTVAATMSALNAAGFAASCAGSGGWFCLASGAVAVLAQRDILKDLDSCMTQCQSKSP
jgi:hypothetical protein